MKNNAALRLMIYLTVLFFIPQIILLAIHLYIENIDQTVSTAINDFLVFNMADYFTLIKFLSAHIIIYSLYICITWLIARSISQALNDRYLKLIVTFLWFISIICILSANIYYVPHSFFSSLIRNNLFNNNISINAYKNIYYISAFIYLFSAIASLCYFTLCIFNRKKSLYIYSYATLLIGAGSLICLNYIQHSFHLPKNDNTTSDRPNIFIIGFDALRPDFLSFFNPDIAKTPHFDNFLHSSIVFKNTYTPLARTFPSWVGILTSQYPLYTNARENMVNPQSLHITHPLPEMLKKAGYETIFATDDSRYNYSDNSIFSFDKSITMPKNTIIAILTTINDFPLSNLIIPTPLGRILFPYHYGNHDSPHTYNSDNFLSLIDTALNKKSDKPLFFAAHINSTAWPFYWYNDKQFDADQTSAVYLYQNAVAQTDATLEKLIAIFNQHHLLNHAIFILLSDHGISLQLPGDRIVKESLYQDNKKNIFLEATPYYTKIKSANLITTKHSYTISTSYGYGSDVLSLTQHHSLLAFKFYGLASKAPQIVSNPTLLLDIMPTLLDLLHLKPAPSSNGISLLSQLITYQSTKVQTRPIFIESSFRLPEIQKDKIDTGAVLKQSISSLMISPNDHLIVLTPSALKYNIKNKQRAIIEGKWMLAYYPASTRNKVVFKKNKKGEMTSYLFPSYTVLINTESGEWTTNLNSNFAATAPTTHLKKHLRQVYQTEMNYY